MQRFLLILRRAPDVDRAALAPQEFADLLADYHAWRERAGATVGLGELLTDHGRKIGADGSVSPRACAAGGETVDGVYVVEAADYDAAVALGRDHPSLRLGSIEARQLEVLSA